MDYKKIFRSKELRFKILHMLDWLPDNVMLSIQYRIKMGFSLNLKNPQRWTEKLQAYKVFYRNPILGICVDKYCVREYVKSKGLKENLVELYGAWDNINQIDFSTLPNSFVLKTNDGGGGLNVILVENKKSADIELICKRFDDWQKHKPDAKLGREWAYSGIAQQKILAEELLVNKGNPSSGVEDFKILCFQGVPKFIIVDKDRHLNHKRNFYDTDWNRVRVTTDHEQFESFFPKPKNFDEMIRVARILSEDFPFVRVDLYNVGGKIYFGELTFYPWAGYVKFNPDSFDFELGEFMDCSSFMPNKYFKR